LAVSILLPFQGNSARSIGTHDVILTPLML
jgi:hypothetical protein